MNTTQEGLRVQTARAVSGFPAHSCTARPRSSASPASGWADLCTLRPPWPEPDLVAAAGHPVKHPWSPRGRLPPLTTVARLRATVEDLAPFHGVARARAALERVRVGAHSAMETPARLALVDAGLGEPLLQHRLDPWDPDCPETHMFSPELAVALEYDGGGHLTPAQQARDARRDRRLLARRRGR